MSTPVGTILAYGGATIPSGWLDCDGSAISRSTYAALFTALGTTWGAGDGSTTFNLPDLRGRTAIGAGTGSGLSARTLGATGGAETHVLTVPEIPPHTHQIPSLLDTFAAGGVQHWWLDNPPTSNTFASYSTGGGGAHNNMQPFAVVKYIIAATAAASTSIVTASKSVGTSALQLCTEDSTRVALTIENWGSYAVYIGASGVTTGSGFKLANSERFRTTAITAAAAWYAISTNSGQDVRVLEELQT
ncbi:MAG: hypothetical protein FJX47_15435 [Alphaproteobacteria bacterium]|nr:hypothetical protein [Alphaproteobacteria bacterium]